MCRICKNEYFKECYRKAKAGWNTRAVKRSKDAKTKVLDHYGWECVCCGEGLPEGLSIDHIDGDGRQHRKDTRSGSGTQFYLWLIKNHFPPGFQTLCMTCNFAKGTKKFCPHQSTSGSKEIKH